MKGLRPDGLSRNRGKNGLMAILAAPAVAQMLQFLGALSAPSKMDQEGVIGTSVCV